MGKIITAIIIILLIIGAYYLFRDDTPDVENDIDILPSAGTSTNRTVGTTTLPTTSTTLIYR